MKSGIQIKLCFLLLSLLIFGRISGQVTTIPIETKDNALVLQTDKENHLWIVYFGNKLLNASDYAATSQQYHFPDGNSGVYNNAYTPAGTWNLSEPALQITHADGNPSTELKYVSFQKKNEAENVTLTIVKLIDPVYKLNVDLYYKTWNNENVIEQWTEITNNEKAAVVLDKYASANLYFSGKNFYLTSFQGEYLKEMQPMEEKLAQGIKSIESKLGTRAMLLGTPNFILSFDGPAKESSGKVVLGQLAWSGNYKLDFEITSNKTLRFIAGINPYASSYTLKAGESFKTPSLIYTISNNGTGQASRQLQSWARKYRVLNGEGDILTLLNNWEATYFDFDEPKLTALFKAAKTLGVDLFLLDYGWF